MASLQELPDDELDKLFRSSAGEFEPPFNPEDWNSLRRRLDDDERSQFIDRFIYWGLPILLLLMTTVSLLVQPDELRPTAKKAATQPLSISEQATTKPAFPTGRAKTGSAPSESSHSGAELISGSASPETDSENRVSEMPVKKPSSTRPETSQLAENNPSKPGAILNKSIDNQAYDTRINTSSSGKNRLKQPATTERTRAFGQPIVRFSENRSKKLTDRKLPEMPTDQVNKTAALETAPFDLITNRLYIEARKPARPALPTLPELDFEPLLPPVGPSLVAPTLPVIGYPALSVRVIMAPDLNFVGKSRKAATNLEIGIVGEYRFARRLTIQSGVMRSVKKYTAAAADYTKPPHWYGPMYKSVDAVCTVLDIPVNLRFDVLLNNRRRVFISSGVSSYIMKKEYYEYNYPVGIQPHQPQYQHWTGKTGLHRFSHLNVSVGYERNFRSDGPLRRVSWQVEPFLKSPLSNLGYGKIRLTSAGVFFSLRYRL